LLDDSLKLIADRAVEKNIAVHVQNDYNINQARVDPDRISQILLNLYLNAIDAMEDGGELTVKLSKGADSGEICITVSDTGHGISPEHLARVFDPYFTTKSSGTGLGLAIAHNIAEAMGGSIKVSSTTDPGTAFSISLPGAKG
jgi:two-component system sensor histidine kinase HydH